MYSTFNGSFHIHELYKISTVMILGFTGTSMFYIWVNSISLFSLRTLQILYFEQKHYTKHIFQRLKLTLFSNQTKDFFVELVMSTMKDREARHIIRPDMIHLLMEAKKGETFFLNICTKYDKMANATSMEPQLQD